MPSTEECDETSNHNISSTLDQLEHCCYLWQHKSMPNFEEIIDQIDQICAFLDPTLNSLLSNINKAQKHRLNLKLKKLQTCLKKTLALVSKTGGKFKRKLTFQCSYCNKEVTVNANNEPVWKAIQNHEHFELLLANRLVDAIPALHIETNQLQMEGQPNGALGAPSAHFEPSYDERVKNIIYPSHLLDIVFPVDNVSDYTVQNRCTAFFCLLCRLELSLNMSGVVSHISELDHQKKFLDHDCMDSLSIYHSRWMKMSPICQSHQVFFDPESVMAMNCLLCDSSVRYDDLDPHLSGDGHKRNFLKLIELKTSSDEWKCLANLQLEIYGIFNNLFGNTEIDKEKHDPKKSGSSTVQVTEPALSVVSTVMPKGMKNNCINKISAGHSSKNTPRARTNPQILKVEEILSGDEISDEEFNLTETKMFCSDNVLDTTETNLKEYCKFKNFDLLTYIYPDMSKRFIQNRENFLFCLICVAKLKLTTSHHLAENKHKRKAGNVDVIKTMEIYNSVWKELPPAFCIHQTYFNRCTSTALCCNICRKQVKCDQIQQHIHNLSHKKLLVAELSSKTMDRNLMNEILRVYESNEIGKVEVEKPIELMQSSDHVINNHISEDRPLTTSHISPALPSPHVTDTDVRLCNTVNKSINSSKKQPEVNFKNLMNEMYPLKSITWGNTIQYRGEHFCLVCNCYLALRGKKHVKGKKHCKRQKDQTCQQLIGVYNAFWGYAPLVHWIHQIYFNIYSVTHLYCWICQQPVVYSGTCVLHHLKSATHFNLCLTSKPFFKCQRKDSEIGRMLRLYVSENYTLKEHQLNDLYVSTGKKSTRTHSCLFELKLFGVDYYYIAKIGEMASCRLCSNKCLFTINGVSEHLNGVPHLERNYYLLPSAGKTIFCVLCGLGFALTEQNATQHLTGRKHISNLSNATKVAMVAVYKHCWSLVPKEYHYQQICFRMVHNRIIQCVFCNCYFDYIKLFEHILGDIHDIKFEQNIAAISKWPTCLQDCKHSFEENDIRDSAASAEPEQQHNRILSPEQSRPSSRCSETNPSENISVTAINSSCEDLADSSVYQGPNKNKKMKFLMGKGMIANETISDQSSEDEDALFDVTMTDLECEEGTLDVERRSVPMQ